LTKGQSFDVPIAHGEGRVVFANDDVRAQVSARNLVAVRYVSPQGDCGHPGPANPNGSELDAAGLCDDTGRIFGLMPHPDRFIDHTAHPCWKSKHAAERVTGKTVFENAVKWFL
ncbi:MAG: phosphoribosylformylglycinamidine synthase subunit PurQ, partial [Phycisphaerae bacterium]